MEKTMENTDVIFERILHSIGNYGKFQKTFNIVFNVMLSVCAAMAYSNIFMSMAVPNHWCHVPGRENTNFTIEEWKNIHLPKELDVRGTFSHSSCSMYNITDVHSTKHEVTVCQYGYDYDHTWFTSTVPTSQDWVCDKNLYVTNVFGVQRFGEVIGSLTLGQFADYVGRRPIYLVSIVMFVIGKILTLFTPHILYAFLAGCVLVSFSAMSVSQCVLVISMEITQPEKRATLAQIQNFGFSFGVILTSLVSWAIPDWKIFTSITSAPLVLFIFTYGFLIESPRWLASRGKVKSCAIELKKIAKFNGTTLKSEEIDKLQETTKEVEKVYGIFSFFSSWRLAKNTLILLLSWTIGALCYFIIILNVTNLDGNPFVAFLWQSVIEIPAFVVGKICCDKVGRRYTGFASFLCTVLMFAIVIFTIRNENLTMITNILLVVGKFFISSGFYAISLQTMEIYPTSLRQTGMSSGMTVASAVGTLGLYIIYLGTTYDVRYPYIIMAGMCLIGAITEFLLPETLYAKLPETLHDAKLFGKDQTLFSLPRKPTVKIEPEEINLFIK